MSLSALSYEGHRYIEPNPQESTKPLRYRVAPGRPRVACEQVRFRNAVHVQKNQQFVDGQGRRLVASFGQR